MGLIQLTPTTTDQEAKSTQDSNNGFINNQLSNIGNASPKAVYATLSALQTAYPTGTTGIYLVTADGKWYYWNGSAWTAGGIYQATGFSQSALSQRVFIIPSTANIPDYNTTTKVFDFKSTAGYEAMLIYGTNTYVIPAGTTVVDGAASSAVKLIFNTTTSTFSFVNYNYVLGTTEILIAAARITTTGFHFDIGCGITINNKIPITANSVTSTEILDGSVITSKLATDAVDASKILNEPFMFKYVTFLRGGATFPIFDSVAKTFSFPANTYDSIFYVGGTPYTNNTNVALSLDLSGATGTSAWVILYNTTTKILVLKSWGAAYTGYYKDHAIIATFRIASGKYYPTMSCPFTVDGKLFGIIDTSIVTSVTKNPLDANVKAISHRGYNTIAPENTLPAYTLSRTNGYSYVETDVQWTSDGVPVVIHDTTVNRTSNGTGNVIDMTLADLKLLDFGNWKSTTYVGTRIPTFEEFILHCKKLNLHPYIEIKVAITSDQAGILVNICKKLGMLRHITWVSFYLPDLSYISGLDSFARLGYVGTLSDAFITSTLTLKTATNEVFADAEVSSVTTLLSDSALLQNLPIEVWTVDDAATVISLVSKGVSGVTTDNLNILDVLSA